MVSFASSVMKKKKNVLFPPQSRFGVKLMGCIAFGSASNACCLK